MSDFPMQSTQYELLHQIARGKTSDVYMARCVTNNQLVAVHIINLDGSIDLAHLRTGTSFWTTTKHTNLISYYGSFVHGSSLWAIFEFLDCGSCNDILRFQNPSGFRDEVLIATIIKNVLTFLKYFHEHNGIHRNLKSDYILVSSRGEVKVAGLWTAASLIENGIRRPATFTKVGVTPYTAPEIVKGHGYTQKVDIWSVGMIALELACGRPLFSDMTEIELVQKLMHWKPVLPDSMRVSKEFTAFLRCCLSDDPGKRPSAADLLKHSFIKLASDSRYLTTAMTSVVPLSQRTKRSSLPHTSIQIQSVRDPIVFDFGENRCASMESDDDSGRAQSPYHMEVVKKGRFTLRVQVSPELKTGLTKKANSAGSGLDKLVRRRATT